MDGIFIDRYPKIDLHGFDRDSARMVVNDFINENLFLGNEYVLIIHGKGMGILKNEIHDFLGKHKYVLDYKTGYFNEGMTIVRLKI